MQSIKTGTYDEVFGKGSTPPWALPTDVMKYQDDELVEEEAGYTLDYKVIPSLLSKTPPQRLTYFICWASRVIGVDGADCRKTTGLQGNCMAHSSNSLDQI